MVAIQDRQDRPALGLKEMQVRPAVQDRQDRPEGDRQDRVAQRDKVRQDRQALREQAGGDRQDHQVRPALRDRQEALVTDRQDLRDRQALQVRLAILVETHFRQVMGDRKAKWRVIETA